MPLTPPPATKFTPPLVKWTENDVREATAINEAVIAHYQEIQARWRPRVAELEEQIGGLVARIGKLEEAKAAIHTEVAKAPAALDSAFRERDLLRAKLNKIALQPKIDKIAKLMAEIDKLKAEVQGGTE